MRLAEPIEMMGMFWLPEEPHEKSSGTLKISEKGEITVDLAGAFGQPLVTPEVFTPPPMIDGEEKGRDPRRIVGSLEMGGLVTLDDCRRQKSRHSFAGHVATSTFSADLAFVGAEFNPGEAAQFTEFSFSIEGLDDWLAKSGIDFQQDSDDLEHWEVLIRAHSLDDIKLRISDDVELAVKFDFHFPNVHIPVTEASVQQKAIVAVKLTEPQPVNYFCSLASKLCHFLTLALDQAVSISSMTAFLDMETNEGKFRRNRIEVYGQFAPWPERIPAIRLPDILFRYQDIGGKLDKMISRWFEVYETFEPAFNLYFALRAQPSQFLDTKVLWLCQALETLHRRSSSEREMPQEEFEDLLESVLRNCPLNRKEWLGNRVRNELSFRTRMRKLMEPFERWFGDNSDLKHFISRANDTRNYLTHFDESTNKHRASGSKELFELFERLEVLFQLHLLKLMDFDDSAIDSIIESNRKIRRRLGK